MKYTMTVAFDTQEEFDVFVHMLSAGRVPVQTVSNPSPAVTISEPEPVPPVSPEPKLPDIYKELRSVMEQFIAKHSADDAKDLLRAFGKERLRDLTVDEQHGLKAALEKRGYA